VTGDESCLTSKRRVMIKHPLYNYDVISRPGHVDGFQWRTELRTMNRAPEQKEPRALELALALAVPSRKGMVIVEDEERWRERTMTGGCSISFILIQHLEIGERSRDRLTLFLCPSVLFAFLNAWFRESLTGSAVTPRLLTMTNQDGRVSLRKQ